MEAAALNEVRKARPAYAGCAPSGPLDLEIVVLRIAATALAGMETNVEAVDPRAQPAIHRALHEHVGVRLTDALQRRSKVAVDGPQSPHARTRPPLASPPSAARARNRQRLSNEATVGSDEAAAGGITVWGVATAAAASQRLVE